MKRAGKVTKPVKAWAALNEDGTLRFVAHLDETRNQVQSWCTAGMKVVRVEINVVPVRNRKGRGK